MEKTVTPGNGVQPTLTGKTHNSTGRGLHEILRGILHTITRLPWLHANAGGVFLADPSSRRLELAAHINFTPQIQGTCTEVSYGHCLCGRVAESGELLHVSCIDHRHETRYPGMADHGHYVVPIKDSDKLLGILTLYVEAGHSFQQAEADALKDFASAMATVIQTDQLRRDKVLADLVVENSRHGVMICDRKKRILWVNRAFEETTGYQLDEVRGETPGILSSGRHDSSFYQRMWSDIGHNGQWQGEIWNRRKSGEPYPEWLNIIALRGENGEIDRYAGMFVDLSEIRQAEERIHRLAYYDELTGLPNRAWLIEKFSDLTQTNQETEQLLYVILIDLDHFHDINDALGREAGNALLREAGRRLHIVTVEWEGILARAETDQFLVVFSEQAGEENPSTCESFAKACLDALEGEFSHDDQVLQLTATAGLARYSQDDTLEMLLGRAGQALRQAKREHRGGIRVFDETLGMEAAYDHHILLNIRHAEERDELFLVYQPQVDRNEKLVGAEALLRWNSSGAGLIPPDRFIPHAEKRGAIRGIGRWVLHQAIKQLDAWHKMGVVEKGNFTLSLNLSPAQLISGSVLDEFKQTSNRYGIPTNKIEIEITETALMQASDLVSNELEALATLGFRIAIDDFGTGYSSLARLHEFPIDTFKIDRSFIDRVGQGGKHLAIVKSLISMAHELGHDIVAEGVENKQQYDILRKLGCERFQGYWFSKPLEEPEFRQYAKQLAKKK